MYATKRTNSSNSDFIDLVQKLDLELAERDGADNLFYSQFNKIDAIKFAIVIYDNQKQIGCGAIKEFDGKSIEVKRMYVLPEYRGNGIAGIILSQLEAWASELNFENIVLETGKRQPEAIKLYQKSGYQIIENYGQYIGIDNSVCFKKSLI